MAEPAPRARRRRRRRRWVPRRALPRSRRSLAFGALLGLIVLVLLLLGIARTRPSREVPLYDPAATTTTGPTLPVAPPSITPRPTSTLAVDPAARGASTTSRRSR